jgi:hypothetical protein
MRSIQTSFAFPLSSVKPFERLSAYRDHCLAAVRQAVAVKSDRRERCPACESQIDAAGAVEGLGYARCSSCQSLILERVADTAQWNRILADVGRYRNSPTGFHSSVAASRNENVYLPKLEWIQHTLRLHGLSFPALLELASAPSPFSAFLTNSGSFSHVVTVEESELATSQPAFDSVQAIVMLESLDRALDPSLLLKQVRKRLLSNGLVFVTALVSSGFDLSVLGLRSLYLYPPDRTNCFSLKGLVHLMERSGFQLVEVSTPGVLDVEIVEAHLQHDPSLTLSSFESQLLAAGSDTKEAFQRFLQEHHMSSFARIVGRKVA